MIRDLITAALILASLSMCAVERIHALQAREAYEQIRASYEAQSRDSGRTLNSDFVCKRRQGVTK